jgi:hypothetical protein
VGYEWTEGIDLVSYIATLWLIMLQEVS